MILKPQSMQIKSSIWMFNLLFISTSIAKYLVVFEGDSDNLLILSNGMARHIDKSSALHFGISNFSNVPRADQNILAHFHRLHTISPIKFQGWLTVDDKHALEIRRIDAIQSRMIRRVDFLATGIKNPSFVRWNDQHFMVGITNNYGLAIQGQLSFWLSSNYSYGDSQHSFKSISYLNSLSLQGLDPRVLAINETFAVMLYSKKEVYSKKEIGWYTMVLAELTVSNGNYSVKARDLVFHKSIEYWPRSFHDSEKNWCPFIFNGTFLMIQSLNPLQILTVNESLAFEPGVNTSVAVQVFSTAPRLSLDGWEWGDLRGGTNALYIPGYDVFLTFFHSRPKMFGSDLVTYYFGGVVFSSLPPFRLLSISNAPIVDDRFYNGPWLHKKACYAPYPTSLSLVYNDLKIVLGFQDYYAHIITLDLDIFMQSLVPAL